MFIRLFFINSRNSEITDEMVGYEGEKITETHKALSGAFAGCVSRFLTQPLDIIKVRWQLKEKKMYKRITVLNLARSIIEKEGITAFWQGHALGQVNLFAIIIPSKFGSAVGALLGVGSWRRMAVAGTNRFTPYWQWALSFICMKYYQRCWLSTDTTLTGCISCTFVNPLEVIRLRQMLTGARYRGFISGARHVYNQGGARAFFEGLATSMLQIVPAAGISFSVFGLVQPLILKLMANVEGVEGEMTRTRSDASHLLIASVVAGSAAGAVSKSITYPLDLVKKRLQIGSHKQDYEWWKIDGGKKFVSCENLVSCLKKAYEKEGFRGLYRGWRVTIFKAQLTSAIAFGSYEIAHRAAAIADTT